MALSYFAGYRLLLPFMICGAIAGLVARAHQGSSWFALEFDLVLGIMLATPGALAIYLLAPGIGSSAKRRVLYVGAVLEILRLVIMIAFGQSDWLIAITSGVGFGVAALGAIAWRCVFAPARKPELDMLSVALFLPLASIIVAPVVVFESQAVVGVLDNRLYNFDLTLGIKATAWMGQLVQTSRILYLFMLTAYCALCSVILTVAAAAERRNGRPRAMPSLIACIIVGSSIAVPLYWFVPAIGPIATFGAAFPEALPTADAVGTAIFAARAGGVINTMPSMHFAGAVMVLWTSWELSRLWRLGGALFCALTVIATLGLGQHYVVDLVAGAPVALFARALCITSLPFMDPLRATTIGVTAALTALWFVPFHVGWLWWQATDRSSSLLHAWVGTIATIGLVFVLERTLTRHTRAVIAP